ncbi:hypothetical protein GCM10023238_15500 [Streptomyces heliomycini]
MGAGDSSLAGFSSPADAGPEALASAVATARRPSAAGSVDAGPGDLDPAAG